MNRTVRSTSAIAISGLSNTGLSPPRSGATNDTIIRTIKEIYFQDAIKTVANWLSLTWKTAKNRMDGTREFTLDEVADIIASEHGFRVITAIMKEAERTNPNWRKPGWWDVCEPLMELADVERMAELARRRTQKAIRKREESDEHLETEIRRAQTLAIQGSGPARTQVAGLRAYAGKESRVVAPGKGRGR